MKGLICPSCKCKPTSWVECCQVETEYTLQDDGACDEIDRDYYGDTSFMCPECGIGWNFTFEEI